MRWQLHWTLHSHRFLLQMKPLSSLRPVPVLSTLPRLEIPLSLVHICDRREHTYSCLQLSCVQSLHWARSQHDRMSLCYLCQTWQWRHHYLSRRHDQVPKISLVQQYPRSEEWSLETYPSSRSQHQLSTCTTLRIYQTQTDSLSTFCQPLNLQLWSP